MKRPIRRPLDINKEEAKNTPNRSSNLLFRTSEPVDHQRVFDFLEVYSAKTVPKLNIDYRKPEIIKGSRWYVEYYFRIPAELQHLHGHAKWKRFRVFKDINRHKTDEYAELLRDAVEHAIKVDGFNPFEQHVQEMTLEVPIVQTIGQGINLFKTTWANRGIDEDSYRKYTDMCTRLTKFLESKNLLHQPTSIITKKFIEAYLKDCAFASSSTYNRHIGFMSTMFNWMVSEKYIDGNPCKGITHKKERSTKHRFYDQRLFKKLQEVLITSDPYLYFACQCVYYLCLRSEKELRGLKVGHIYPERRQAFVGEGKTGERFVSIPDELMDVFRSRGILDANPKHFVFSVPAKNKWVPDGKPGPEPFGNGFFSKRFSKLRKKIGITEEHTIYGLKHTRIIHLKLDGVADQDIMALTGHTSYDAYSEYLKDLGLNANSERVNAASRKF